MEDLTHQKSLANTPVQRIYRIAGYCLIFAAVFFLSYKCWQIRDVTGKWQISSWLIAVLALGSIIYALTCVLLAFAWSQLLKFFGEKDVAVRDCVSVYARTLIARYIPGNFFHIAGRYLAGRSLGFSNVALTGATVYEVIGILLSSSALALLGQAVFDVGQHPMSLTFVGVIFIALALFPLVFNKLVYHFKYFKKLRVAHRRPRVIIKELFPIFLLYVLFFIILSGIYLYIVHTVSGLSNIDHMGKIISIFSLSIIAGFLTPGAPGGLGVREAIIVGFMTTYIGESQSIFIALLFRIVTIVGECVFFLSSFFINPKTVKHRV